MINVARTGANIIATSTAVVVSLSRAWTWLKKWLEDDRIKSSLDRMDSTLEVAHRLDAVGETVWAAELRKDAWMVPMRRLARYEMARAHPVRVSVIISGWLLYLVGIGFIVAGSFNAWFVVPALASLVAAVCVGLWWLATQNGWERRVTARAEERYEQHRRDGRVAETQDPANSGRWHPRHLWRALREGSRPEQSKAERRM